MAVKDGARNVDKWGAQTPPPAQDFLFWAMLINIPYGPPSFQ